MATLKQLRTRLKSMHSTRKITSAMKLVAASRWRRQQERWKNLKEYVETFDAEVVTLIAPWVQHSKEEASRILVVCTPHKGLCGGYPSQVKQAAKQACVDLSFDRVLVTTDKGRSLLADIPNLPLEVVSPEYVADQITTWKEEGHRVSLIRGVSRHAMAQEAELTQLLPYELPPASLDKEITFEPDGETLASAAMLHALTLRWQCSWLESIVAEEAARMSAMDQATRNADDAIALLQRTYNRMRQERITTELVEMISGSALA